MKRLARRRLTIGAILLVIITVAGMSFAQEDKKAHELFWRGRKLIKQQKYNEAILKFDELLVKYPESKWAECALYQKGRVYKRLGRYEEAIKEWKLLIKTYPKGSHIIPAREDIAGSYKKLEKWEEALNFYQQIVDINPHSASALYDMAHIYYYKLRKYKEALKSLETILAFSHEGGYFLDALRFKATCLERLYRWKEAIEIRNQFIETAQDPENSIYARYRIGMCYENLEKPDIAAQYYRRILLEDKRTREEMATTAVQHRLKQIEMIKSYLQTLKKSKDKEKLIVARLEVAKYFKPLGNYPRAIAEYREVVKNYPNDKGAARAQWEISWIYYRELEDYAQAVKAFEEFIENSKQYPQWNELGLLDDAWAKLGGSYEQLNQWAEAFNAYQMAVELDLYDSDAQAGMERTREKAGQPYVTKIVRLPNLDTDSVAFSLDGKKIAYTMSQKKNGEKIRSIKIIDTDGNTLGQFPIKSAKGASWFPSSISWSPDGKKIAYSFEINGGEGGEIWVVNSDGTNNRRLVKLDEYESCSGPLNWTSDSGKIIFDAGKRIDIINIDGTGRKILKKNITPPCKTYLSPDGRKIAFQDNHEWEAQSGLRVMDADGQNVKCLTENLGKSDGVFDVSWLSKTDKLIYTVGYIYGTVTFGGDLWSVNSDGTVKKELVKTYDITSFASSPDGKRIIYVRYFMDEERNRFTHMELWVINSDGSNNIKLCALLKGENDRIVNTYWSSDGKTVALVTLRGPLLLIDLKYCE